MHIFDIELTYYCTSKSQLESSSGCCSTAAPSPPSAAGRYPGLLRQLQEPPLLQTECLVPQCCSAAVTALYARINRGRRGRCPHHLWSSLGLHHTTGQDNGGEADLQSLYFMHLKDRIVSESIYRPCQVIRMHLNVFPR